MEQSALKQARRVVVKVGSALLTNDGRGLDRQMIENLAAQICTLVRDGKEVVFVSSGRHCRRRSAPGLEQASGAHL